MGGQPFGDADFRPSDSERDEAIGALRDGVVQGRLSSDTFAHRVDRALAVRSQSELTQLVSDLPIPEAPRGFGQRVIDGVGAIAHFHFKVRAAWRRPSLPPLVLPGTNKPTLRIGRMPECDLQLFDTTVSRYHAELRRSPDGWFLVDLGSMNGTRVNGWRISVPTAVRAGDEVSFGSVVFSLNGR
jgi:hypothetical protein